MSESSIYSIWLMPKGAVSEMLGGLINRLATNHNSETFPAHLTLLGSISTSEEKIIEGCKALATTLSPFLVELGKIKTLDTYYQSFFIEAKTTTELAQAYSKAKNVFNLEPDKGFMPHLSLMYGDFSSEIKKNLILELGEEINLNFIANEIHLYQTSNEVSTWNLIESFTF